jgi:hypothetical protein
VGIEDFQEIANPRFLDQACNSIILDSFHQTSLDSDHPYTWRQTKILHFASTLKLIFANFLPFCWFFRHRLPCSRDLLYLLMYQFFLDRITYLYYKILTDLAISLNHADLDLPSIGGNPILHCSSQHSRSHSTTHFLHLKYSHVLLTITESNMKMEMNHRRAKYF